MSVKRWADPEDIVLYEGRGLYVVRLAYGGEIVEETEEGPEVVGGVARTYDLEGLEGQEPLERVEGWRLRVIEFPLPEIVIKARRR